MITVLGATGTIGREVVKYLRNSHVGVRAVVRDVGKAGELRGLGAEIVAGDLEKPESLRAAFEGSASLFLLVPVSPQQGEMELDALAVARAAGVGRVVKLSAIGADALADGLFSRAHGITEDVIKASGLGWTIVRGAFFSSNLLFAAEQIKQGQYTGYWGDKAAAFVDPADLAGVCGHCLLTPSTAGFTYTATGPEALTNSALCEKLSAVLGRPIKLNDIAPVAYRNMLVQYGAPPWMADAEVALGRVVVSGEAALVTNTVPMLLGRPAISIETYIRENAAKLT